MWGYADYMWVLARNTGISGSLAISIAQAETQCATDPNADQIMVDGHNAWGFGHSPGTHGYLFPTWPDAMSALSNQLASFIYGQDARFPACDTVYKLSGVWVNGNFEAPASGWATIVGEVMQQFGGNPNQLQRSRLWQHQHP